MAELYQYVLGTLHPDFLQMKTTDGIYLKDLLEQEIFPALALYNSRTTALQSLFAYDVEDSAANIKKMYSSDGFDEVSELAGGPVKASFDSWNRPIPIRRFASKTKLTLETIKQMSSKQIVEFHNAKLIADQANIVKQMFVAMCKNSPTARVDALTSIAATPKAFWNADGVDTPRSNGQISFANTHQHYLSVASTGSIGSNGSELDTLISKITEHEQMNGLILLWAQTGTTLNLIMNEATNFKAIKDIAAIIGAQAPNQQTGFVQALINGMKVLGYNVSARGTWKNAVIMEAPDIPSGYILATSYLGDSSDLKPLAFRTHPQFSGLMILSETGQNPFIGQDANYRRYLGLGVWNRDAGACLYLTQGGWAEPTFV